MVAGTVVTKSMLNKVRQARCQTFDGSFYRLENGRGILQAVFHQDHDHQYIDSKSLVSLQELYPKIRVVMDLDEVLLAKRKAPGEPLVLYKESSPGSEGTRVTIGLPRRKLPRGF